jgi:hypothetical protein
MNSHPSALAAKSAGGNADDPKAVVVVALTRVIIVASGRATIPRIVDPGAAALRLPTPIFRVAEF